MKKETSSPLEYKYCTVRTHFFCKIFYGKRALVSTEKNQIQQVNKTAAISPLAGWNSQRFSLYGVNKNLLVLT